MVFGWGKKKPRQIEKDIVPEIKQITLSKISDIVKEISLLRSKTIIAEVRAFRNKINNFKEPFLAKSPSEKIYNEIINFNFSEELTKNFYDLPLE